MKRNRPVKELCFPVNIWEDVSVKRLFNKFGPESSLILIRFWTLLPTEEGWELEYSLDCIKELSKEWCVDEVKIKEVIESCIKSKNGLLTLKKRNGTYYIGSRILQVFLAKTLKNREKRKKYYTQ